MSALLKIGHKILLPRKVWAYQASFFATVCHWSGTSTRHRAHCTGTVSEQHVQLRCRYSTVLAWYNFRSTPYQPSTSAETFKPNARPKRAEETTSRTRPLKSCDTSFYFSTTLSKRDKIWASVRPRRASQCNSLGREATTWWHSFGTQSLIYKVCTRTPTMSPFSPPLLRSRRWYAPPPPRGQKLPFVPLKTWGIELQQEQITSHTHTYNLCT